MTTEAKKTSSVSIGELLTIVCVVLIAAGFLLLPWLDVDGTAYSGLALLTDAQTATSYDLSQLYLIPAAAVVGALAGLWGLLSAENSRRASILGLVASLIGAACYVLFVIQNRQRIGELSGVVGIGFWLALVGTFGLFVQVFLPRVTDAKSLFISLRVKLLITFTALFAIIFAAVFLWFNDFARARALDRLAADLEVLRDGALSGINGDEFQALYQEAEPNDEGTSDDPRFWEQVDWLATIRQIDPRSNAYTLILSEQPDVYYFVTNAALRVDPENSAGFFDTLEVPAEIFPEFPKLFDGTREDWTLLDPYTDDWGTWISGYRAIHNSDGEVVGVVGTDLRAEYLAEVQKQVSDAALPAFVITYIVVFATVYGFSVFLTRPISRLRAIAVHIGEGNYDIDLSAMTKAFLQDEINKFAQVFEIMVGKVRVREETLKKKVEELRIEIDTVKQQAHVSEIVDTDFFRDLQAKARQVRGRKYNPESSTQETPPSGTEEKTSDTIP
jgi:HAMP domain-containing protein